MEEKAGHINWAEKNSFTRDIRAGFFVFTGWSKTLIPACAGTASAALRSSLVIATYREVRLIPPDFARLAAECF